MASVYLPTDRRELPQDDPATAEAIQEQRRRTRAVLEQRHAAAQSFVGQAAERDRWEAVNNIHATLAKRCPALWDHGAPIPLKIGIHDDIVRLGHPGGDVGRLLKWWTQRPAYFVAIKAGGPRYNLDGQPEGEVSEEHQLLPQHNTVRKLRWWRRQLVRLIVARTAMATRTNEAK